MKERISLWLTAIAALMTSIAQWLSSVHP